MSRGRYGLNGLKGLEGEYQDVDSDLVCRVRMDDTQLVMTNILLPLEKISVMLYKTKNRFCLRGSQVELTFTAGEAAAGIQVRVKSAWKRIDGKILEKTLFF